MDQPYDYRANKAVVVLASTLSAGVALNVTGHLCASLGAHADRDLMGRRWLVDASGVRHAGISKYPVIATKVKPARLRRLLEEARNEPSLFIADYPQQMLDTGHDDDLAKALEATPEESISYLGALIYGATSAVDALTGKFMLWT
ncbi:DUF2000 domain-containing protein [Actinocorallia herbida]|uniref:DUF2000 domain-containing protein n=1 Tax=Actinocorallia herbida TaxID=58109 RepID=UPI0014768AC2|nr:DUF2000 domain-containing protein [Actinocorallia herbida]